MKSIPRALILPVLLCLLIPALSLGQAATQEPGRYFTELPDLPLMPGMAEMPDAGVSFDKPEGRIVEVYAQGTGTAEEVLRFYRRALPQLGWTAAGPRRFRREGEVLDLEVQTAGSLVTLRCALHPE